MKTTHVLFVIGVLLLGVTLINEFEYTGNVVKLPGRFDVCSDDKTEVIFVNDRVQAGKEIHVIYCNKPGDQLQATGKIYKKGNTKDRFIRTVRFCTSPRSWLFVTGFATRDQNIECINFFS